MSLRIIFLLNLLSAVNCSVFIDILKYKNVNNVVLFNCCNSGVVEYKALLNYNFRIMSIGLKQNVSYKVPATYPKIGLIVDTTCDSWGSVLSSLQATYLFKSPFYWLINTEDLLSTVNILSQYPIEVDSELIIILRNESVYNLFEMYNSGFYNNGSVMVRQVGVWNSTLQLKKLHRRDLSGVELKCTVVVTDSIVNETFEQYLKKSRQTKVDSLHKLKFFTLLKYLRAMYNMSYKLQRTNSWGYFRNGSFDGMVGALQRQEADIGGTPVFFRPDRAKFIDYTAQTWQSKPCFIMRHPKYPGGFYSIYTRPLTETVWGCILGLLTIAGCILCLMLKMKTLKIFGDEEDSSSSLAVIFLFSAVCQQGWAITKSSNSVKLTMLVTFLFTLTLYQYYNATVVSTLLRETPKSIRTLKDLLHSNLKAGVENVLYNTDFFKRTTDPVALELFHKKIVTSEHYNFFPPEQGMALVKHGGFAFHVDSTIAYRIMRSTFTEREICEAHEVSLYPPQNMAAVVKKKSPYKDHLAYGIRKMQESGLMNRLKLVWDEPKPPCVHTPDSSIFSVSIREFSMALIVLAVGMMFSIVILFCEIFLYRVFGPKMIDFRH